MWPGSKELKREEGTFCFDFTSVPLEGLNQPPSSHQELFGSSYLLKPIIQGTHKKERPNSSAKHVQDTVPKSLLVLQRITHCHTADQSTQKQPKK